MAAVTKYTLNSLNNTITKLEAVGGFRSGLFQIGMVEVFIENKPTSTTTHNLQVTFINSDIDTNDAYDKLKKLADG